MDWNESVKGTFLESINNEKLINISREDEPEKGRLIGEMTPLEKAFYTAGRHYDKKAKAVLVRIVLEKFFNPEKYPEDLLNEGSQYAQRHDACITMVWTLIRERFPEAGNISLGRGWKIYDVPGDDEEKEISSEELSNLKARLADIIKEGKEK